MKEEREIGYYKVKQYNHKSVIWYWNGKHFESVKSKPQLDEVESIEKIDLD